MKNNPCPRCGKTNPAEIHTCTPKQVMEQALKEQDQSIDLNRPVGFYIEPKVVGVFSPYFVRNRDVPIFAKDNAIISPVFKHPYSHEDFQGYLADLRAENAKLACLLSIKGEEQ
jgi:hypothetical protein